MSGTYPVVVGDRGRLVIPAELRERCALHAGAQVVLIETPGGLVLMTRDQLKNKIKQQLSGKDLLASLLADRRAAAHAEDTAAR